MEKIIENLFMNMVLKKKKLLTIDKFKNTCWVPNSQQKNFDTFGKEKKRKEKKRKKTTLG